MYDDIERERERVIFTRDFSSYTYTTITNTEERAKHTRFLLHSLSLLLRKNIIMLNQRPYLLKNIFAVVFLDLHYFIISSGYTI